MWRKKMTITELKAHAYDCIAQIERWKQELQKTNENIANLVKTSKEEKTEEPQK